MSKINVKLGAEIISDDRRIWLVHAGHQRRLLSHFFDQSKIFLELPGLGLTERILADEQALRQRIKFAEALREAGGLTKGDRTIQIGDFDGSADRAISQAIRVVRHMFSDMKVGDLIVVPTGGAYTPVRFGEIATNFTPADALRAGRYDYADLPARKVEWLPTERLKRDIPVDLVRLLEKPPAVSELHRTDRTEKFFEYAYPSYIKSGEGWSLISAPGYDGNDPLAIVAPHELVAFCVALYWASEKKADLSGMSFEDIIRQHYSVSDIEDFGVSFTSPGKLGFKTRNPKLAAFVTSMIAILGAGAISAASVGSMPDVSIGTQSRAVPIEIQETERQLDYAMKAIDAGVVVEAIERSDKAKRDVDLKADATVSTDGN